MLKRYYIRSVKLAERIFNETGYLTKLPVVRNLADIKELRFQKPVTFFVGENGTGKSTLLEALAVAMGFNAEGGSRNFNFSTNSTESRLHEFLAIAKADYPADGYFLRAESFYNVASNIDELDRQPAAAPLIAEAYGGLSLHQQSHGESFLSLVQNRFRGNGLYILDEPEAALSPNKQLVLLSEFKRLVDHNSQLIISTHSPLLMAYPEADIFVLSDDGITLTRYEETEHYMLTRQFLDNPGRMLQILLGN